MHNKIQYSEDKETYSLPQHGGNLIFPSTWYLNRLLLCMSPLGTSSLHMHDSFHGSQVSNPFSVAVCASVFGDLKMDQSSLKMV